MRYTVVMLLSMLSLIFEGILTASALLLVPTSRFRFSPESLVSSGGNRESLWHLGEGDQSVHGEQQVVRRPGVVDVPELVFDSESEDEDDEWDVGGEAPRAGPTLLKTQLAITQDISIFASYVRDYADLDKRFNDGQTYSVVLAPSNAAVSQLRAKPWEFPLRVIGNERQQEAIIKRNIRNFIESHVYFGTVNGLSLCPEDSDSTCFITEAGVPIKVQQRGSTMVVKSLIDGTTAKVIATKEVKNGVIWTIDGLLSKP